ncbi:MAG: glycoside hydrolase family 127 protein [Alistipes sp.]|nr:glycoside hydrolase family 127 protein [Alistipes sp.]
MNYKLFTLCFAAFAATACGSDAPKIKSAEVPMAPYAVFTDGLHADITPEGWLKEILVRQNNGLTSHPEAMSYPFDSDLWVGELERDSESRGSDWWRYEQTAYYIDGLTRLGYLLDDKNLLDITQENIDWVLDHPLPAKVGVPYDEADIEEMLRKSPRFTAEVSEDPKAQARMRHFRKEAEMQLWINSQDRPEGRLGADVKSMAWPFAVFFRAMKAYYEATGDERIPAALERHYLSYTVEEMGRNRFVVNVEGILWTYAITQNPRLLSLAQQAWAQNGSELTQENCLDESELHMHGVTMNELMKVPVLLYQYTGNEEYLRAALNADYKMERDNMLVDGVNSSSEALAGNDALASHETCDISDYTWSIGYFLMATGDARWADRIEKAIFNAALGAITKDFKSMQYFSCPNQFIATGNSNHNEFKYGLTWMAYRPIHETECCIGNLHRYMPNYAARMWLKDAEGQPVAALYGPSAVEYALADGVTVHIEEKTAYPFEEKIDFVFNFYKDGKKLDGKYAMNFTYRIPEWCTAEEAGFKTVSREWHSGEVFTVELPMQMNVCRNPAGGLHIERGPIVYSYPIEANVEEDTQIYDNLAGKVSGNPDFKSWNMTPAGKWNYAIATDALDCIEVKHHATDGFPFDPGQSPVTISIPVVEVAGWTLVDDRFTPALPGSVATPDEQPRFIELVPYGSTTLRLTIFPTYAE